jgi:dUTP pyrophosphatase
MSYRGSIKARFKYVSGQEYYKPMDRIAQIMIIPTLQLEFTEVDELDETERGEGGFGSTGTSTTTVTT